ncbi:MAG TPA: hypothetical protein ENF83_00740 [Candidatus Korarchaeota archaeon]|nr:hypothetical protein [Candidatus Korarchaeota archaeon]
MKDPLRLIINRLYPEKVRRGNMLGVEDVVEILAITLIGVVLLAFCFYLSIRAFEDTAGSQTVEGGMASLLSTVSRILPLAVAMVAAGYLVDRGLWALVRMREGEGE